MQLRLMRFMLNIMHLMSIPVMMIPSGNISFRLTLL
ncbi:Uncharacterised protein [Klebsiella pneumoniae]|nr:Uncharacterised protein [Klebsiella pneumoniae]SYE01646.1 Uncharacterised protein [Klebsiella pneumoniae]SYF35269.1 Uncharacterised protein [Klebsiella pneumoniae]SYO68817.1 Uncharacterised protein [Klebsiella pneumoniae]